MSLRAEVDSLRDRPGGLGRVAAVIGGMFVIAFAAGLLARAIFDSRMAGAVAFLLALGLYYATVIRSEPGARFRPVMLVSAAATAVVTTIVYRLAH